MSADESSENIIEKRPAPNRLERAMAVLREHGYIYERAEVYRKRINHLQAQASENQAQNSRGEWVPAIPEPYFLSFGRVRCECGEKRRGRLSYREHYALVHILGTGDPGGES